jgi:hypothetical protein
MTILATLFMAVDATSRITRLDWAVIAVYFSILLCVAWWVVRRGRLPGSADLRGVFPGCVFQEEERKGYALVHTGWIRSRHIPNDCRYTSDAGRAGISEWLPARLVPVDRQQYLFPILQRADHAGLGDRHDRGELRNFRARLRNNQEPHL